MKRMRIVLTGPECTGKSRLTEELGNRLNVPFALEYARVYLEEHGPAYEYDLLLTMSRNHKTHQREHVPCNSPIGILDTDLINYKVWCDVAYGKCHPEIHQDIEQETHHVYLLCYPDIPWVPDPLREHPTERDWLFARHRAEIERLERPYAVIQGDGIARLELAEEAIRIFLKTGGAC